MSIVSSKSSSSFSLESFNDNSSLYYGLPPYIRALVITKYLKSLMNGVRYLSIATNMVFLFRIFITHAQRFYSYIYNYVKILCITFFYWTCKFFSWQNITPWFNRKSKVFFPSKGIFLKCWNRKLIWGL